MKNKKIAVVGATGMVGRTFLSVLAERGISHKNVFVVASSRSEGQDISFGDDHVLKVHNLETFDFSNIDIGLFSPGSKVSKIYAPKAASQGCLVIDNTSCFRMDEDVPLIVPEVNPEAINQCPRRIIANPNCSMIQTALALKPIHDLFKVKKVIASTYQSVSGAGKSAMDELFSQTKHILIDNSHSDPKCFVKPIAFNVIPKIDDFVSDGFTKEEWKMTNEIKKILDPSIELTATCVRVPVFIGHCVSLHVTCDQDIDLHALKMVMKKIKGLRVVDNPKEDHFITPLDAAGEDDVFISRLRADPFDKKSIVLWCVADNIRKGAATNAIQIAELFCKEGPKKK